LITFCTTLLSDLVKKDLKGGIGGILLTEWNGKNHLSVES
jgi:hypothetical protein